MPDQVSRSAAKLAALIAVPVALLVGVGSFFLLGELLAAPDPPDQPAVTATGPAPVPTAPVAMPARELSEPAATACAALLADLPAQLDDAPRRAVTEGADQNAAYGEPPIRLACGVPAADYQPTDDAFTLSGVCWHATAGPEGTVWTTLDREVPVRVTVPPGYEGATLVGLSPAIIDAVPASDSSPFGCAS